MTKTTPKRTRARTVATIREFLIEPPWRVSEHAGWWMVTFFIDRMAPVDGSPVAAELRTYRFDAQAVARECCADLNANYLADKLTELDE